MTSKTILNVALLAFLAAPSLLQAEATPDLAPIEQKARVLYRSGQYEDATRLYRQLARLAPNDPDVLKQAMWAFWNMHHYEEAASTAKAVLSLSPTDVEAHNIITWAPRPVNQQAEAEIRKKAVAAYQAGRYDDSTRLYRDLAQREPKNAHLLQEFMWSLWNVQRWEEASDVAKQILKLNPNATEAQDVLHRVPGQVAHQKMTELETRADQAKDAGDWAEVIETYRQIDDVSPGNPSVLTSLAGAQFRAGQLPEARATALRLVQLRPTVPAGWNLLAKIELAANQQTEAINALQRSLELNPHQALPEIQIGRFHVIDRNFKSAVEWLERANNDDPLLKEVYPLLGKAYFYEQQYAKSNDAWQKALGYNPDDTDTRYNAAQAQYYSGHTTEALAQMKRLAEETRNEHALMFWVDDAICQKDFFAAERAIESFFPVWQPKNEGWAMKLASLYEDNHQDDLLIRFLDRFLQVWPNHPPSLEMKAGALYAQARYAAALPVYQKLCAINPYSTRALQGLAACQQALNQPVQALRWVQTLRATDPTDPLYLLEEARAVNELGEHARAQEMLEEWLKANHGRPVLGVLLYHGLTPFSRDPLLAYPYHDSLTIFESQMRGLHEAGFTPVTAEDVNAWRRNEKPLPPKAMLIAFDDDRRDSFVYADPVLEKYGLKATMFVPVANVDPHHPPAFMAWDEIKHYKDTGRWEIQDHGADAHNMIPVNEPGGTGLFLVNKMWLQAENRIETDAEWQARLEKDYQDGQAILAQHLGEKPSAFALPEGLYGQQGNSNSPQAEPVNMALLKKYFAAAYTQDQYGINVRSKDPYRFTRVIPDSTWTGADLVKHFRDKSPSVLIELQLLEWATWDRRTHEAYHWLSEIKKDGATPELVLAQEAEIRFAAGDLSHGRELLQRANQMDDTIEGQKILDRYAPKSNVEWTPTVSFLYDNARRRGISFNQMLDLPTWHNVNWRLQQLYGYYEEPGTHPVNDHGLGVGADWNVGLYNTLSANVIGHALSARADNTVAGSGSWQSRWTDRFQTTVQGGRDLYFYARALNANVASIYEQAVARWYDPNGWEVLARGQHSNLTDHNWRVYGQGTVGHTLNESGSLRLLYRYTYEDSGFESPNYYSPRALKQHQLGPEVSILLSRDVLWLVEYLPGYGKENGASGQLVHDVETYWKIRFTKSASLTPTIEYQKTPTYWETIYSVGFKYVF